MLRSCNMVWNVPYLNVWGNPLPIAAVPENENTTNVTSLQSVWLIEYHGSLYYLIKGNRKIIFKKNCNNPAFCPRYVAPAGVECSWNEHNNFICNIGRFSLLHVVSMDYRMQYAFAWKLWVIRLFTDKVFFVAVAFFGSLKWIRHLSHHWCFWHCKGWEHC